VETRHAHGAKEARCLQGDGLTPSVWTRDDHCVEIGAKGDVYRDNLISKEGVSAGADVDPTFVIELWLNGLHFLGQFPLGKDEIKPTQHASKVPNPGRLVGHRRRQFMKDPQLLLALRQLHLAELIVDVNHSHWLNEEGGAA